MKKIYSASITPFTESGALDVKSLERLLEFNIGIGIEGFFFLGTMGEWAVLGNRMKLELLEAESQMAGHAEEIADSTRMDSVADSMMTEAETMVHDSMAHDSM